MTNIKLDIFQAIRNSEINVYEKNISNFNINMINKFGQSLLHEAIIYKQHDIALDLLKRDIDVNIQDNKGQTVLHFISFYPDAILAEHILEKGGNLELIDSYGNTALWYAVFNARGKYEIVKLFMKYKSNQLVKNKSGRSPTDFAKQIKDELLLDILK